MGLRKFLSFNFIDTYNPSLAINIGTTVDYHTYNLNNIYDVDDALSSVNTLGLTEWATFFLRYRVIKTKITCEYINTSTDPVYVGMYVRPIVSETTLTTWQSWRDLEAVDTCSMKLLTAAGGSRDKCTITRTYDMAKIFGDRLRYKTDPVYTGRLDGTSNPTPVDCLLFALDSNGVNIIGSNHVIIKRAKFCMYTQLYNRKQLLS